MTWRRPLGRRHTYTYARLLSVIPEDSTGLLLCALFGNKTCGVY